MNCFRQIFVVFLVIFSTEASALTVGELEAAYQSRILRVNLKKKESLDQLRESYRKSLTKIEASFQKAGRLQDVLLARKEKELIEQKVWPLPRLEKGIPSQLQNGRKLYDRSHLEREQNAAKQLVVASEKMEVALEDQIVSLTKGGKIKEATKAKELLKSLKADEKLKDAIDLMARVGKDGQGPPAYHIRRFGDEIEVIVRYDRRGKVSLDSPVGNIIEITGGKSERGTTKAKSLGEFVGAKGYQPDPWTVYENDLVKGELGALKVTSLTIKGNEKTAEGQSGLKITMPLKTLNPHMAIANALPPLTEAGEYRMTCSYYIPKSNQGIVNFTWHQGFGAPIESHTFEKKGEWTTKTISSKSLNEMHHLRLYLGLAPGKVNANAIGESLFLKDLKVEQFAFSTYIVKRYGDDGSLEEAFPDAANQKKLTSAGALLPRN